MSAVPKRTALVYLAIGILLSAALVGSWQWARTRYELPALWRGGGVILAMLLYPALVGFGYFARSFRIPPRIGVAILSIGVAILSLLIVLNLALITYSYSDRLTSSWYVAGLSLLWTLAFVALWLLARAWRTPIPPHAADRDSV